MNFKEEFLHYVWQFRLLTKTSLYCSQGEEVQILNQGVWNTNAGPDFSLAKIKIGPMVWLGNVEIHVRSSDWLVHQHHLDKAYDSVILHVVYIDDCKIYRTNGSRIPTLILKDLLPEKLYRNYKNLLQARNFFPCAQQLRRVDPVFTEQMLLRVLHERMEDKATQVIEKNVLNHNNWKETFYYLLFRNFGFKVNAVPFEMLADSLNSSILMKHRNNALQVEALLFGQAGLLYANFHDDYPQRLKQEYNFLRKKYNLRSIDPSLWKFLRMRPYNFPVRRIAQLAALMLYKQHFLSSMMEVKDLGRLRTLFNPPEINEYWETHFHFDKEVKKMKCHLGSRSIDNLIINTVCMAMYSYGKCMHQPHLLENAVDILKKLPAERNTITAKYAAHGMHLTSAFHTQSVLHLNKSYCNQKKCLNCIIGNKILIQ